MPDSAVIVAVRDSIATRARLLDAATEEFGARGLAGARVDRIAENARANKQLIYAYFGSKENLFEAALAERCAELVETVPFDADDLPGYAGRLFDHVLERPAILRLLNWAGLERPEAVRAFGADSYRSKVKAIRNAQRDGRLDPTLPPAELLAIVFAVAGAWFTASEALRAADGADPSSPQRLRRFRRTAVEAVTRIVRSP